LVLIFCIFLGLFKNCFHIVMPISFKLYFVAFELCDIDKIELRNVKLKQSQSLYWP